MKLMCAIMILMNLFVGSNYMPRLSSIDAYFKQANSITVYSNGETINYAKDNKQYVDILDFLKDICEGSREMPAYGVSLNEETKMEMQNGLWIELNFNKTKTHNEMPFDSLLIRVEKEYQGFNIIRGQKGMYEGRCFHIYCPQNTMENLYNYLQKI